MVIVVVTMESNFEPGKAEALPLLGIALGLFNLADHAIVHFSFSPFRGK
jgi:hypothetical protein